MAHSIKDKLLEDTKNKVETKLPEALKQPVHMIVLAGGKILYSPQTHAKMVQPIYDAAAQGGFQPDQIAKGILNLLNVIAHASQGKMNPAAAFPAGVILLCYVLDDLEQTKGLKVTPDLLKQVTTAMVQTLKQGLSQGGAQQAGSWCTAVSRTPCAWWHGATASRPARSDRMNIDLGLAGAISGAGEGASKALQLGQAQWGAERLQEARDKMDNDRQARLLEHQSAEGAANRAHTSAENTATRENNTSNTGMQITSAESTAELNRKSQEDIHEAGNKSAEKMNALTNLTNEKIHNATNALNLKIAQGHDMLQRETNDSSLKTSLASVINASEREITRLQTELLDPLKNNPNDPQVTLLRSSIDDAKREVAAFKSRYQQLTGTTPAAAPAKLPAFVPPPMTKPGLANSPVGSRDRAESAVIFRLVRTPHGRRPLS